MIKTELVKELAKRTKIQREDAKLVVDTVIDGIIGALAKGENVEIRGFGSFKIRERGPRNARNPKTGDKVQVPAKKVAYFKPGKEFKTLVKKS